MTTTAKPTDTPLVSCEVCLKQVPVSEATVPEAADYVAHFCGLECYEQWTKQRKGSEKQPDKPSR